MQRSSLKEKVLIENCIIWAGPEDLMNGPKVQLNQCHVCWAPIQIWNMSQGTLISVLVNALCQWPCRGKVDLSAGSPKQKASKCFRCRKNLHRQVLCTWVNYIKRNMDKRIWLTGICVNTRQMFKRYDVWCSRLCWNRILQNSIEGLRVIERRRDTKSCPWEQSTRRHEKHKGWEAVVKGSG